MTYTLLQSYKSTSIYCNIPTVGGKCRTVRTVVKSRSRCASNRSLAFLSLISACLYSPTLTNSKVLAGVKPCAWLKSPEQMLLAWPRGLVKELERMRYLQRRERSCNRSVMSEYILCLADLTMQIRGEM